MILIRETKLDDTPQIAGLLDSLFPGDPNRPSDRQLADRAESGSPYLFVAADKDIVAGFAILNDRPFRPWTGVDFVGVDPAYEGRGLGTTLTQHLLMTARRPLVRLFVRPSNTRASQLYQRCGFRMFGRRRASYADGEDALIMMARGVRFPLFPHGLRQERQLGQEPSPFRRYQT